MNSIPLGDLILLGDTLRSRTLDTWLDTECGCALGRAYLAGGYGDRCHIEDIKSVWPWLTDELIEAISSMFREVCEGRLDIVNMCEWVNSLEPVLVS